MRGNKPKLITFGIILVTGLIIATACWSYVVYGKGGGSSNQGEGTLMGCKKRKGTTCTLYFNGKRQYLWRYYRMSDRPWRTSLHPWGANCRSGNYGTADHIKVCGQGEDGVVDGYIDHCQNSEGYWRLGIRSLHYVSNGVPDSDPYAIYGLQSPYEANLRIRQKRDLAWADFAVVNKADGSTKTVSPDLVRTSFERNIAEYQHMGWSWAAGNFSAFCAGNPLLEPRKFKTTTKAEIDSNIVYSGSKVSSKTKLLSKATDNKTSKEGLPDLKGKIQIVEFTLPAGAGNEPIKGNEDVLNDAGMASGGACSYFDRKGVNNCNLVKEAAGPYNKHGLWYHNQNESDESSTLTTQVNDRTVPDNLPVGSKYCIALAAYPSKANLKVGNNQLEPEKPFTWNVSNASCRTIAKKPNFQVWNGSVFTRGNIKTSQSNKIEGTTLGKYGSESSVSGKSPRSFGSWSESAIIANGDVQGFSSAAGLGFGGYAFDLPGGNRSSNILNLSHLTISNTTPNHLGHSNIGLTSKKTISKLKNRYRSPSKYDKKLLEYHDLDATGNHHISGRALAANTKPVVYKSSQTVYIDANLCYSDDGNCNSDKLADHSLNTNNIAALPQILIFAKNVKIKENVTRIDAWIISENNIDTCDVNDIDSNRCNQTLTINGPVFAKTLSLNRSAGAWSLPEYGNSGAGVLGRNYAATGSVAPAEVFNLRADTLLWASRQARLKPQTNTVYLRELAPRY